jgi:hypothetical protein
MLNGKEDVNSFPEIIILDKFYNLENELLTKYLETFRSVLEIADLFLKSITCNTNKTLKSAKKEKLNKYYNNFFEESKIR